MLEVDVGQIGIRQIGTHQLRVVEAWGRLAAATPTIPAGDIRVHSHQQM